MANPLTGGYEAVVQIAIRQINGLLGTLHQNADQDAPLKLLHSTVARIGDPRRRPPDVGAFGDWVVAYQRSEPGRGLDDVRSVLTATAPPGVAKAFSDAFVRFDQDWVIELPPDVVRGRVKLQVGSVSITVPAGSSTEVTIHAGVRAQYYPDPGAGEMPQPVHGEVHAAFDITKVPHGTGRRLLIRISAQDNKIHFIAAPGSGLIAADESRISTAVRTFIREGLVLLPIDLPADFAFSDFKGLGSSPNQVIALPLQLSGAAPPPNGLQGINQSFIGSSGFGFAVSKEHVSTLIELDEIRQAINGRQLTFTISYGFGHSSVTYTLNFSSGPTLTFTSGGIEIAGRIDARTGTSWAPNGYVSFKQQITLLLNQATQAFTLERVGDPDVDESWFIPHGRAVDIVRTEIDKALVANRPAISGIFASAKNKLVHGLRTFDASVWVSYTAVEITAAGVTVRGEITGAARRAPVAAIAETHGGAAFTALESWIPAGQIDRFVWSWVEHSQLTSIWSGVEKSMVDEHRFILPKPAGISISQVCLRVEGTQIAPSGQVVSSAGGTTCHVPEPEFVMDIPSWWEPLTIPFWRPTDADAGPLRQAIAGHLSVQAGSPSNGQYQRNALVYFVDGRRKRPLDPLIKGLGQSRSGSAVVTTVVVPAGTFDAPRREVEDRLGLPREGFGPLHITEDEDGGWTRTFGVAKAPSIYLINSRREFVWRHDGEPDPAALAAALDENEIPIAPTKFRPLTLSVSPGDAAPDVTFEDGGDGYALHRLRGRAVLLNFWQSWSAPCLVELQRLQRLHHKGREAPFVVAFHGGSNHDAIDEVRKRLGLAYPLVQDSQQQVARRYGVRCWPTTITIAADGAVEHIQFGTAHQHGRPPTDEESVAQE